MKSPRGRKRLRRGLRPVEPDCQSPSSQTTSAANEEASPYRSSTSAERQASFPVYYCQWVACTARLHNLKTLQAHLTIVHCQPNSNATYSCRWNDCQELLFSSTGEYVAQPIALPTEGQWHKHMWHEHVSKIAWRLGDGPTCGLSAPIAPTGADTSITELPKRTVRRSTSHSPRSNNGRAEALHLQVRLAQERELSPATFKSI